ncbi:MAG: hypothetical protein P8Z79_13920 [Sedimentisphaerales bacterium]
MVRQQLFIGLSRLGVLVLDEICLRLDEEIQVGPQDFRELLLERIEDVLGRVDLSVVDKLVRFGHGLGDLFIVLSRDGRLSRRLFRSRGPG